MYWKAFLVFSPPVSVSSSSVRVGFTNYGSPYILQQQLQQFLSSYQIPIHSLAFIYRNLFVSQEQYIIKAFFIQFILLMGKGKIIITNQDADQDQQVADQSKAQKLKHKKMKNKLRKERKNRNKVAAIEMIANNQQRYQEQQEEEVESEEKQAPVRTMLSEKCRMKNLTICFPDSILEIPQTSALRSYFISEVARISSIFKVDEIVILKDHGYNAKSQNFNPSQYIARNLQYLETPQYLRKHLFKMHPDLKNAGLMNPIQCHHHLKVDDVCQFREGVSLDRPTKQGAGSWVDIGLKQQARMNCMVLPNTRVTLRLKDYQNPYASFYEGEAISKRVPRQEKNYYWGYDVRIANNFKQMLSGDYDIKLICNHHEVIKQLDNISDFETVDLEDKSIIIFFSGTDDLSTLVERDEGAKLNTNEILKKFDYSLAFQNFGVQKLRMEEQLFMALSKLSRFVI